MNKKKCYQFTSVEECFETLRSKYDKILTTHLGDDSVSVYDIDFKGSIALIFGNETYGVSEDIRVLADGNFLIPQMGIIRSLNISVACAVSIYEAYRQKNLAGQYDTSSIPQQRRMELFEEWGFKEQDIPAEEL